MDLSIYTKNFDKNENIVNNGLSEYIFIEDSFGGKEFKSLDSAINFIIKNNISITNIIFYYKDLNSNEQMFKKFKIQNI